MFLVFLRCKTTIEVSTKRQWQQLAQGLFCRIFLSITLLSVVVFRGFFYYFNFLCTDLFLFVRFGTADADRLVKIVPGYVQFLTIFL